MYTIKIILLLVLLSSVTYADQLESILQKNYNNNHFKQYNNYSMQKQDKKMPVLMHKNGSKRTKLYFEQFQDNTDYEKHLFVYHSGRYKGLKLLLNFDKEQTSVNIWVPQLKKTIGVNTFNKHNFWNGSNFTYAEVLLKNLDDCTYEVIGKSDYKAQNDNLENFKVKNYCSTQHKTVIKVKSTPKKEALYDYSISYIDDKTYHDYKVEFYKDKKLVKTIEKCWYKPNKDIVLVGYWHAKNHINKSESLIYIPKESHIYNTNFSENFFTKLKLHQNKKI